MDGISALLPGLLKLFMIGWGIFCLIRGGSFLLHAQTVPRTLAGFFLVVIGGALVIVPLIPESSPEPSQTATLKVSNGVYTIQVTHWDRMQTLDGKTVSDPNTVWLSIEFESDDPTLAAAQLNVDFSRCGVVRDITGQTWTAFGVGREQPNCLFLLSRTARNVKFQLPGYPAMPLGF